MRHQQLHGDNVQTPLLCGLQKHQWRATGPIGLQPTGSAKTPFIARLQSREPKLRTWRAQVVSPACGEAQKNIRHHCADCMHAHILLAGLTAAISVKTRQRHYAAGDQLFSEYIFCHDPVEFNLRFQYPRYFSLLNP